MSHRYDQKERTAVTYVEKAREFQSIGRYHSSFDWARKSLDYRTYGEAYLIMGRSCQKLGKLAQAVEYLKEGSKLYEKDFSLGIGSIKWIQDYSEACLIISGILYDKGKFKESFQFADKATLICMSQQEKISRKIEEKINQAERRKQTYEQEKKKNQKLVHAAPKKYENKLLLSYQQEEEDLQNALRASQHDMIIQSKKDDAAIMQAIMNQAKKKPVDKKLDDKSHAKKQSNNQLGNQENEGKRAAPLKNNPSAAIKEEEFQELDHQLDDIPIKQEQKPKSQESMQKQNQKVEKLLNQESSSVHVSNDNVNQALKKSDPKMLQPFKLRPNRSIQFEMSPDLSINQDQLFMQNSNKYRYGKIGLDNLGNTCYMNATLQCLCGITQLKNYFFFHSQDNDIIDPDDYNLLSQEILKGIREAKVSLERGPSFQSQKSVQNFQEDENQKQNKLLGSRKKLDDQENHQIEKESQDSKKMEGQQQKKEKKTKKLQDEQVKTSSLFKHRGGVFTQTFAQIVRSLWISGEVSLFPDIFYNTFTDVIPHFLGYSQQDAAQFLIYCLQILHNELNVSIAARLMNKLDDQLKLYSKFQLKEHVWKKYQLQNQSIISRLFTGMMSSKIKCNGCTKEQTNYEFFNIFPVELPGNQEYRVRFVPLCKYFDEFDYTPRTFQIQILQNEYLDKKTILKKSFEVLKQDYRQVLFKQKHFQVYQEINFKQAYLYEFDDEKGLHYDSSTLVLFGHNRFQSEQSTFSKVKILLYSSYPSFKEYIIYPIEYDKSIKNIKTTINQYLQKRNGDRGKSQSLYNQQYGGGVGRNSIYDKPFSSSSLNIDFKIFDNIPTDPKTETSYKCQVCSRVHSAYRNCLIPYSFEQTLLSEFQKLITQRQLIFVGQIRYSYSYTTISKLKQTKDIDNPNIISDETALEDCIRQGLKLQKLQNFKCDKCGKTNQQTKQIFIEYLPDVLIIQLNRFLVKKNQNFFKTTKNNILVRFSEKNPLDMNGFIKGGLKKKERSLLHDQHQEKKERFYPHRGGASRKDLRQSAIVTTVVKYQKVQQDYSKNYYDLEGIVYHHGSSNSGHYYAKRKQIDRYREQVWVKFNDTKVDEIKYIYSSQRELPQNEAYLLFYHRRNEQNKNQRKSNLIF